ncbi:hypothetical protein NIT60_14920 [Mammaliicoccus sciuri]|nr:hypothetical protein NIT60_14920 [Mammaliicoccus sciuri]
MGFKNIINNTKVMETVDKLNSIKSLNNNFIYLYNEKDDWFDIIHSVEDLIQESDEIALQINEILVENLIKENILNFSIYEDKKLISENTLTFIQQTVKNSYGNNIGNNFKIDYLNSFKTNKTKTLQYA